MTPQVRTILRHLVTEGSITPMIAGGIYKVRALPRRIADLKDMGVRVEREIRKDATGQRYAHYTLPQNERKRFAHFAN